MGKKGGVRIKQVGPKVPNAAGMTNPMEGLQLTPEEMQQVQLPPPPDRNFQIFWPMHEAFTMETDSFQVIYPSYIDKQKTIKQGRRVGLSMAVETPTVSDMSLALQQLQCRHVLQPHKGYSRDIFCTWDNPGRILVDVSNYKKTQLMQELCERIPDLPERHARLAKEQKEREAEQQKIEEEKRKLEAAAAAAKPSTSAGKGNNKKKGKKGRKK